VVQAVPVGAVTWVPAGMAWANRWAKPFAGSAAVSQAISVIGSP
jgi:hypothetical protein